MKRDHITLNLEDYRAIKNALINDKYLNMAISFINPYSYYLTQNFNNTEYCIDGYFVDGMLLQNLLSFKTKTKVDRISFDYSSIAKDFLKFCENNSLAMTFIGGNQSEITRFVDHIISFYPSMIIKGYRDGFFNNPDETANYIQGMEKCDVIVIGMGAPLQEKVASLIKKSKKTRLAITCGGFISQTAQRDDYYFEIIKKTNLRWLQRMIMHPHVRRKVFSTYPIFLFKFLIEIFLERPSR